MWSALKALATRIGLSSEQVADVERDGDISLVQDSSNPRVQYKVRPDPDWTRRMGEAWSGTLTNSRRETAGIIPVGNGLLSIVEAHSPENAITAQVVPGKYEITLTIAHMGAEETYDYEEHVSHAFALLQDNRDVASIEPLTDEHGVELRVDAHGVAFAGAGILQEIAGDHAGRWTLRISGLMHPKSADGNVSSRNSIRVENDDESGAAIILYAGYGRGEYPLFRLADVNGKTVGVMADFFVDNRPW
jgi:hypothetical protein